VIVFETKSPSWEAGAKNNFHNKSNGSKHSSQDYIEQFREVARQHGFELPAEIIADGKVQRFGPGDACAYCFHSDGVPNGWVQDWRQGATRHQWKANGLKFNAEDRKRRDDEIKAAKAERDADKARKHEKASAEMERAWKESTPASEDHPYLVLKRVKPHGLREHKGKLLVPIWHDGKLCGTQSIQADGDKRFLPGTQKTGRYYIVGEIEHADRVCIAEGFATASTIYERTGIPCVVAFDAGNLPPVAKALKLSLPGVEFVVCADHDWRRVNRQTGEPENIGLIKAREAALAIDAKLAVPDFSRFNRGEKDTDFNDLDRLDHEHSSALDGCWAVHACIEGAKAPGEEADKLRALIRQKYRFHGDPVPPLPPALIKGMLPSTGTGLANGQSGAGKTFAMIDLAVALASKGQFFGKDVRTRVGTVFISAEGAGQFNWRIDACTQHRGVSEILPLAYLTFSGNLANDAEFSQLLEELPVINAMFREEYGVPLGMVVLDTMSATFAMENQNDAAEVTAVCKRLKQIGEKVPVFAFGVHHLGKDETRDAAGSFAWRANVDVMWSFIATGDRVRGEVGRREFCISKSRDGVEGPVSDYQLDIVELGEDEDGDPITSCVIEPVEGQPKAAKKSKPLSPTEKVFEDAFNEFAIAEPIKHRVDGGSPEVIAVDADKHKAEFFKRYPGDATDKLSIKAIYNRLKRELYAAGKYRCDNDHAPPLIWKCKPPADDGIDWDAFTQKMASKAASKSEATL
jgi:putative DNA primase/helicase